MNFKNFDEWLEQIPQIIKQDRLWELETYRRALFLADLVWFDSEKLLIDERGKELARQMIRSAGSISANIEEGYGRGYGKEYARFLRIALGSARETRGWYVRSRHFLETNLLNHRLQLINDIIATLITLIQQQLS